MGSLFSLWPTTMRPSHCPFFFRRIIPSPDGLRFATIITSLQHNTIPHLFSNIQQFSHRMFEHFFGVEVAHKMYAQLTFTYSAHNCFRNLIARDEYRAPLSFEQSWNGVYRPPESVIFYLGYHSSD